MVQIEIGAARARRKQTFHVANRREDELGSCVDEADLGLDEGALEVASQRGA